MNNRLCLEPSGKGRYLAQLDSICAKRDLLDPGGPVALALQDNLIEEARERIERLARSDLEWDSWRPPLLSICEVLNGNELAAFDDDLNCVLRHTTDKKSENQLRSLLSIRDTNQWRQWHGRLLELSIKARSLKSNREVAFDVSTSTGRDVDLRITIDGRSLFLESTVLSQSRDDEYHWRTLHQNKKVNRDATGFRSLDLAGNTRRVYLKLFDKVATGLDVERCQFSVATPNVLLLGFPHPIDMGPKKPWVEWAFGELFQGDKRRPSRFVEYDLRATLERHAVEEFGEGSEKLLTVLAQMDKLLKAPQRIGAVLLFDQFVAGDAVINPFAFDVNRVSEHEVDELLSVFEIVPVWCRRLMAGPDS